MELGTLEILAGIGILCLTLYYYYSTSNFNYWEKRHVKGPKPIPFFGNFKDVILGNIDIGSLQKKYYEQFKDEQLIGMYVTNKPFLIVKDPELIKDVLIKDFHIFNERGLPIHERAEPIALNLVNLEYTRWKPLRSKLSPVFTSGKLKEMFYLITECAHNFQEYVEKLSDKGEALDIREITARFTTDSIGVCAFGLNTNAMDKEENEFRKVGRSFFDMNFPNKLRTVLRVLTPNFYNLIGPWIQSGATHFFIRTVKDTMKYRRENKIRRHDFVDLLMDLQDKKDELDTFELTDKLLIAQAFVFFLAGFETSSTTMSNALFELALNDDIQEKLREEIRTELESRNGKLTYDSIKSMKYLDKVIKETLRKYPPATFLQRSASDNYTFSDTKVSITKDVKLFIPVWAIHRDPEIYPKPEVFDPERFTEENIQNRHPMNYLPFGDGPHNCIGARFANYQTKIGVAAIIQKFKVTVCKETSTDYKLEPRAFLLTPKDGILLKISKI